MYLLGHRSHWSQHSSGEKVSGGIRLRIKARSHPDMNLVPLEKRHQADFGAKVGVGLWERYWLLNPFTLPALPRPGPYSTQSSLSPCLCLDTPPPRPSSRERETGWELLTSCLEAPLTRVSRLVSLTVTQRAWCQA